MNQDDQEQEGILSTVQSTVVHSAQAGLEVTHPPFNSVVAQRASALRHAISSISGPCTGIHPLRQSTLIYKGFLTFPNPSP